jgi:hypothetical protein
LLRLHRGLGMNLKIIWSLKSSNCKLWTTADQVWDNVYIIVAYICRRNMSLKHRSYSFVWIVFQE